MFKRHKNENLLMSVCQFLRYIIKHTDSIMSKAGSTNDITWARTRNYN